MVITRVFFIVFIAQYLITWVYHNISLNYVKLTNVT